MRLLIIVFALMLGAVSAARAQVSIGFTLPGVSIGIQVPVYPELVRVPGYPVYYAPDLQSNYFFYDGLYWVFQSDNWYASNWYDGPWAEVGPYEVPLYVLRLPVRYYRSPPQYFRGWRPDAPPRWGEHWGPRWQERRPGWDRWDRRAVPAAAPRPSYQRQYNGPRYPHAQEQQQIRDQYYRHPSRDVAVRERFRQHQTEQRGSWPPQRPQRGSEQRHGPPPAVAPQPLPRARQEAPQRPDQARERPRGPDQGRDGGRDDRRDQARGNGREQGRDNGHAQGRGKDDRGQGRGKGRDDDEHRRDRKP